MKKVSLIVAAAFLMSTVTFAQQAPAAQTQTPSKTEKKDEKKAEKKGEKKGEKKEKKEEKKTDATKK